ncbi:hypothetical protein ACJJIF_07345 [Microbulbifer sp. SSSA002]|uniref:hypothetical protein n=1 Tax=unclassified Microbulbifer TaxID=2619833 RepID=UPI00403A4EC2
MANINKTSVREEMDRLKAEFQRQCAEKLLSQESRLLLQSVFTLLELILAIFLEKKTAKTNKNSSKPSSQTDKDESALPHKGKGKQKPFRPLTTIASQKLSPSAKSATAVTAAKT